MTVELKKISDIFPMFKGLTEIPEALRNGRDEESQHQVIELEPTDPMRAFIPDKDELYVFDPDALASVLIALDSRMNTPLLIWGLHGCGKTTLAEQTCAYQGRPAIIVNHDVSTEVSDVVGNWVLRGGETVFEYGPLARAMIDGLVYIADEYDFALPNVLSVYQNVLNGGNLYIKNAPADKAIVRRHPNFRFIATGNTNGSGDEVGLYQGTQIQNAANYSRFGVTIKMDYQEEEVEKKIILSKQPRLPEQYAAKLIQFGKKVRDAFAEKTLTNTVSTRELITICRLSIMKARGSNINWKYGTNVGFINRLPEIDRKAVQDIVAKVF